MGDLANKLWNNAMDKILEAHLGHKIGNLGFCIYCNRFCVDIMEEFKLGKRYRCTSNTPIQDKE